MTISSIIQEFDRREDTGALFREGGNMIYGYTVFHTFGFRLPDRRKPHICPYGPCLKPPASGNSYHIQNEKGGFSIYSMEVHRLEVHPETITAESLGRSSLDYKEGLFLTLEKVKKIESILR